MATAELLVLFKKNFALIIFSTILGGLLGVGYFLVNPPRYIASGSFFVARSLESVPVEFKYEGYYASMSSMNYAKTLATLIESDDLRVSVLSSLKQPITRKSLRSLDRSVSVKKAETQVVTMQVKAANPEQAKLLWQTYKDNLLTVSTTLNKKGDSKLVVTPVTNAPAVFQSFNNLVLTGLFGAALGFVLSVFGLGTYFFIKKAA